MGRNGTFVSISSFTISSPKIYIFEREVRCSQVLFHKISPLFPTNISCKLIGKSTMGNDLKFGRPTIIIDLEVHIFKRLGHSIDVPPIKFHSSHSGTLFNNCIFIKLTSCLSDGIREQFLNFEILNPTKFSYK